jgi:hypothetical protein
MDVAALRRGELIAAVSGIALFIIMFLSWFGGSIEVEGVGEVDLGLAEAVGVDTTFNAWQAFDFIDIVLLVTVIVAVGLAVLGAAGSSVNLPVAASALTAGFGILSTLLILYRIIDTPFGAGREYGVYLGLIAAAGVAIGGWMAMQEEGTTFGGEADRFGDRYGGPGERPAGEPPPSPPPPPPSGGTGTPPPPPPPSTGP